MPSVEVAILNRAMRLCGDVTPTDERYNQALRALNDMIASWSADGLKVYAHTNETFTLVVGTAIYTWGSGGTITTARPVEVIDAYITDSESRDYPVDTQMSLQEYNSISNKTAEGRPTKMYFNQEYPLAKVKFNREPATAEVITFDSIKQITAFAARSTAMALPLEYNRALVYNLAIDIAPEYDHELAQEVYFIAKESKSIIEKRASKPVSPARLDAGLLHGNYNYDINSDI